MSLFSVDETSSLQKYKAILGKVDEMRKQRISLESQLRDLIHKDDITGVVGTFLLKLSTDMKSFLC